MHLFACGSIRQGHEMLGDESRGWQCAFMALRSILYDQNIPVSAWSMNTIDAILMNGDRMYLLALRSGLISDSTSLPLFSLPSKVRLIPEYQSSYRFVVEWDTL